MSAGLLAEFGTRYAINHGYLEKRSIWTSPPIDGKSRVRPELIHLFEKSIQQSSLRIQKIPLPREFSYADISRLKQRYPRLPLRTSNQAFTETLHLMPMNHLVYSATYTIHENRHRVVSPSSQPQTQQQIAFLGCSFTFGEGLNDEQSFPSVLQSLNPKIKMLNFGQPGYGPSHFLFEIQNQILPFTKVYPRIDKVIYTMLEDHIERDNCNLNYCLAEKENSSRIFSPKFSKSDLSFQGVWADDFFLKNELLHYFLSHSLFIKTFNILGWPKSDEDLKHSARILKKIKKEFERNWDTQSFIVVLFPGYWTPTTAKRFRDHLSQNQIEFIDLSQVNFHTQDYDLLWPFDGHPSPLGAEVYARMLNNLLLSKKEKNSSSAEIN